MRSWNFIALLHNLEISEPFDSDYVAIVPKTDDRIGGVINKNKTLKCLVDGFTDQFQREVTPSILIVREDAPRSVLDIDAIIAFRNIFATCSVIESRIDYLNSGRSFGPTVFSNYFDIFPIQPTKDYKDLFVASASVRGFDEPDQFRGHTTPGLATGRYIISLDSSLTEKLLLKWKDRYIKKKTRDRTLQAIFRSLEMAYLACRMPENHSSIYDYGTSIALWVSAFEIMVHPKTNRADLDKVVALLKKAKFIHRQLNLKKYRLPPPRNSKQNRGGTLIQKLYRQIYESRNYFFHGEPVKIEDLFPFKKRKRAPLTIYATVVYKIALKCLLDIVPDIDRMKHQSWLENWETLKMEEALLTALEDTETRLKKRKEKAARARELSRKLRAG